MDLKEAFTKYLKDTLDTHVRFLKPIKSTSLPFYILNMYDLFQFKLYSREFILLASKTDDEKTPGTIKKNIQLIQKQLNRDVVLLASQITSFNRKRLIKYKIPFVIPGKQMYLPDLKIDLREHFLQTREKTTVVSPSTQAALIYMLTKVDVWPVTPKKLAETLGYSRMTMTRALDEIESIGLGEFTIEGRERLISFKSNKRELWETIQSHLKTPVKDTLWLKLLPDDLVVYVAGLSALSRYSMLAEPKQKVFAVSKENWKLFENRNKNIITPSSDDAVCRIEIWSYPPQVSQNDGVVDQLSLYLSLQNSNDERIESALENMIREIEW